MGRAPWLFRAFEIFYRDKHRLHSSRSREILAIQVKSYAIIEGKSRNRVTRLHLAARYGRFEEVKFLTSLGANVSCMDIIGSTLLQMAASRGHCEIIQLLVHEFDADICCQDVGGFYPLHNACERGQFAAVHLLVDLGSDTSWTTNAGLTPLHSAARGCNPAIV